MSWVEKFDVFRRSVRPIRFKVEKLEGWKIGENCLPKNINDNYAFRSKKWITKKPRKNKHLLVRFRTARRRLSVAVIETHRSAFRHQSNRWTEKKKSLFRPEKRNSDEPRTLVDGYRDKGKMFPDKIGFSRAPERIRRNGEKKEKKKRLKEKARFVSLGIDRKSFRFSARNVCVCTFANRKYSEYALIENRVSRCLLLRRSDRIIWTRFVKKIRRVYKSSGTRSVGKKSRRVSEKILRVRVRKSSNLYDRFWDRKFINLSL